MDGLTAKVFRTFNASFTLQQQLDLGGELDNKRGAMTLEIHRLMQALTKERQISKMLEEGLGYTWPGLYGETVNAFNKQKLSEVQKLRGE